MRSIATGVLLCMVCVMCIIYSTAPTRAQDSATPTTRASATLPPTNTPRPTPTAGTEITEAPTLVSSPIVTETTQTPTLVSSPIYVVVTSTPTPPITPAALPARLCADCSRIRLRSSPGTAGPVVTFLDNESQLTILGRSDDGNWVQVSTQNTAGDTVVGWIAVKYVVTPAGQPLDSSTISALPVLDTAVDASPTATTSGAAMPSWLTGVTAHSRQIFLRGQGLGNRPNVFSRVGDSISASPYFLTPIGQGHYQLGNYADLGDVISYFSQATAREGNSFVNPSFAAGSGWSAFTLLLPGFSSPKICGTDSPLVCEYKQTKPAVALIMVGTNDSGSGSPDQFGANLRQIIQTTIDMGVVPVLSTIPPKRFNDDQSARVDSFNTVIRQTAQQFDIPLWDYFSVMQSAPNGGISKDGLHPSIPPDGASARFTADNLQYGFTIRNLMALQVLDVLWHTVLY